MFKFLLFLSLTLSLNAMSIQEKKQHFIDEILPHIADVYDDLNFQYNYIKNTKNIDDILKLQKLYKVKSRYELLLALKPHPKSIALAQAIVESGWGSSRFYKEANNVFGIWSSNKNQKRLPALEKRGGTKTIYLRKYDTLKESIQSYYFMLATLRAYKRFRLVRYETDDVSKMVAELDLYSEKGKEYTKTLQKIIDYNKLTRYDE